MVAQTSRNVVIFTGRGVSLSTIELIETISEAYPHWQFTILHQHKPRRWFPYLKGKARRLAKEPISYPIELICQSFSKVRRRRRVRSKSSVDMPRSYYQLAGPNVSYRPCSNLSVPERLAAIADLEPWLGIALSAPLLKPEVFTIPQSGTINLHKSMLPEYRGMPPGFWELHDGAEESGVSVHWVDAGLDTGDVIFQKALPIPRYATCEGLSARLDVLSHEVLLEALRRIDAGVVSTASQGHPRTATRSRPAWRVRRTLHRRLQRGRSPSNPLRGRKPDRAVSARGRELAKWAVLAA